jgi:hypothetical protein
MKSDLHRIVVSMFTLLLIASISLAGAQPTEPFDYGNFDDPTVVDNPWLTLSPGHQLVLEGNTVEDGESIPHQIVFTVTDLVKVIDGIESVVVYVTDLADDELVEAELAFFAQDNDGVVWHMGEYPEEYEDGEIVEAPAWIAGYEDALAGVMMPAEPQLGTPDYAQGWGPAVEWTDRGQIHEMGLEVCVPTDCYQEVLVVREYAEEEEESAAQLKYYAQGVGNIKVGFLGEDATQEELELAEHNQLDADELAEIRAIALALEASAYETSPELYGLTAPAEVR